MRKKKRTVFACMLIAIFVCSLAFLAACGDKSENTQQTAPTDPVEVGVEWPWTQTPAS